MAIRCAVHEGTARYRDRLIRVVDPSHFDLHNKLWFSSIGLGVYPREIAASPKADALFREALVRALQQGCNHIDAAISHRSQQGEHLVGQVLATVFARGQVARDEVIISTRGGQVLFEGDYPTDAAAYVRENLIGAGVAAADEFAQGWHHCMSPRYLRRQFRQSLTNLGLGALDIYYVFNPEVQLIERGPAVFEDRLRAAFAELEAQIHAERLAFYGIVSADGFRVTPGAPAHLSLSRLVELAQDAGGQNHHLRYVQAPFNLAMREIAEHRNQLVNGRELTLLRAAQELGITVIGSTTLWQGQLAQHLPVEIRAAFPECSTNAQAAIQFARSIPGLASAVVGMSNPDHIAENMAVAHCPRPPAERLERLIDSLT